MSGGTRNYARAVSILLIAALPAAAQDAGIPPAIYAERAQYLIPGGNWEESECRSLPDAGTACDGLWLPAPRAIVTAQEIARLRAENASLRAAPTPTPVLVLVALGLGVVLGGAAVGYVAWQLRR